MSTPEVDARVRALHAKAVEATNNGRPMAGRRMLLTALKLLGWPASAEPGGEPVLVVRVLNSLAGVEVVLGNTERGFILLDAAEALGVSEDRGLLLQQRGLLLVLVGRITDALVCMDEAIPLLREAGEPVIVARALLNRALLHQTAGRVRLAMADLDWCTEIARHYESERGLVAKALHGRGQCKVLTGDIPAALRDFDAAGVEYARQSEGMLAPLAVDKARALLAAGLPGEAALELDSALTRFPSTRMDQEHAEAELTRAHAALATGDHVAARKWAVQAQRHFRRRGNATWAGVAVLTILRADFEAGTRMTAVAATAASLARQLRSIGLRNDAETALLLSARANITRRSFDEAAAQLDGPRWPGVPLANRLLRRLAQAELAAARGERRKTFTQVRAGLQLLRTHRGRVGSLDLRTGAASLGGELARTGLAAALETGDLTAVFTWLDRFRAQAFRARPVSTPADGQTLDAVAELRHLAHEVRNAELAGRRDPEARRRCRALEREIRAKGWQSEGAGEDRTEATYQEVKAELENADAAMISYLADRGKVRALVVSHGRAAMADLGDLATVTESLARLRSDLSTLCGRNLPEALRQVILSSARRQLDVLAEELLEPLGAVIGDLDVVLVPTGILTSIPWGLIPVLRGRPVTVTPSPSAWFAVRRASQRNPAPGGRTLVVAGPALDHAPEEAARLAAIYPDGHILRGQGATVKATLEAVVESTTAHFAAHGHHERDNVLFSRLDLVDGPLMAYDIHQLQSVPAHVVLSSCDVGQTVVRAGDEFLGFTAALLYSGSRSVVSSVAKVDDRAVVDVMCAYHRSLAKGVPASRALADASLVEPWMPFVCFGGS